MTNDEINKYIAVEIMGLCWHEFPSHLEVAGDPKCKGKGCRVTRYDHPSNPDYTSDASPRSLLNAVVAKVMELGYSQLATQMVRQVNGDLLQMLNPTAEHIARACVEAHKLSKGDKK